MVDGQHEQAGFGPTSSPSAPDAARTAGPRSEPAAASPAAAVSAVAADDDTPAGGRRRRWAELERRASTLPDGPGVFATRTRRAGWLWLAASLPLAIAMGTVVHGEQGYVAGWVLVSGLFTTPALVIGAVLCRRVDGEQQAFWRWWAAGTASLYLVGCILLVWAVTGAPALPRVSGVFGVAATVAYSVALIRSMRQHSGARAVTVDLLEAAMCTVGIVALAVPVAFDRVVRSDAAWFTVPSALIGICLVSSLCWAMLLFRRLDGPSRAPEAIGVVVALLCIADAVAQTAQGVSGFALPAPPLFVLQALCMGLLMMTPLHEPKVAATGLDRLPPHAQVRGAGLGSVLVIGLLAALVVETVAVGPAVPWAGTFLVVVVLLEVVLLAARYQLAAQETHRLYGRIAEAAEERRHLLTEMVHSVDHDRHRTAARLHEQATSAYVAFASYLRTNGLADDDGRPGSLGAVREELAAQAESFRQLMLAIRPLEGTGPAPRRLTTTITAYVDSLYGDAPAPVLVVDIDPDVELDWTTETVAFRILQEALRNVWAHAQARHVRVAVGLDDDRLVLEVDDDGRGFDPDALLYESGLATMRSFTDLSGGSLTLTSAPGAGTSVVAALGEGPAPVATAAAVSATSTPATPSDPRRGTRAAGPIVGDVDAAVGPHLRLVDSPTS